MVYEELSVQHPDFIKNIKRVCWRNKIASLSALQLKQCWLEFQQILHGRISCVAITKATFEPRGIISARKV